MKGFRANLQGEHRPWGLFRHTVFNTVLEHKVEDWELGEKVARSFAGRPTSLSCMQSSAGERIYTSGSSSEPQDLGEGRNRDQRKVIALVSLPGGHPWQQCSVRTRWQGSRASPRGPRKHRCMLNSFGQLDWLAIHLAVHQKHVCAYQ